MDKPIPKQTHDAIVIGAGIAGVAAIKALKNNDLNNFLVLDAHPAHGMGTSGHDHALCHPYIGRGASRLQRLSMMAFAEAISIWAPHWSGNGVFHLSRDLNHFNKELMSERLLSQGFNHLNAQPLSAAEAKEKVGISVAGTFFPEGGWVSLKKICDETFKDLRQEQKQLSTVVQKIERVGDLWHVYDAKHMLLGVCPRVFLTNGLGVQPLLGQLDFRVPLKPVRGQLSTFGYAQTSSWAQRQPKVALSGKAYCLPPKQLQNQSYEWTVGSSYDENSDDLNSWPSSDQENLDLIQEMLNDNFNATELKVIRSFVGIRCVANDRLPIMGPVIGHPGLYTLTALGSRGVMWSALACQLFTEHLAEEMRHSTFFDARFLAGARLAATGLSDDLVSALLPARFLAGVSNSKPILPSA